MSKLRGRGNDSQLTHFGNVTQNTLARERVSRVPQAQGRESERVPKEKPKCVRSSLRTHTRQHTHIYTYTFHQEHHKNKKKSKHIVQKKNKNKTDKSRRSRRRRMKEEARRHKTRARHRGTRSCGGASCTARGPWRSEPAGMLLACLRLWNPH